MKELFKIMDSGKIKNLDSRGCKLLNKQTGVISQKCRVTGLFAGSVGKTIGNDYKMIKSKY